MFERSFHFIPANRPEFFDKIGTLPADAIVFDLEDSVATEEKRTAIRFLHSWLADHDMAVPTFVRVNGMNEPWIDHEIELLASHPELGLVLPKSGGAAAADAAIRKYLGESRRPVILLIEDSATVPHIGGLSTLPCVWGIGIGFEDILSGLRFTRQDLDTLVARIRTEVAVHCAAAGITAIDSISLDLGGGEVLEAEATAARAAGMTAMFSIHPRQLATINRIFSPAPDQIEEARVIVSAAGIHGDKEGYRTVDGILLSPPKIRKARAILEFANRHER
jgi:citrate lyase subunit beta/citryl-CoA lyase